MESTAIAGGGTNYLLASAMKVPNTRVVIKTNISVVETRDPYTSFEMQSPGLHPGSPSFGNLRTRA